MVMVMQCSYYIVLPLTLLPSCVWQRLQKAEAQELLDQALRLLDGRTLATVVKALPGMLSPVQAMVGKSRAIF